MSGDVSLPAMTGVTGVATAGMIALALVGERRTDPEADRHRCDTFSPTESLPDNREVMECLECRREWVVEADGTHVEVRA